MADKVRQPCVSCGALVEGHTDGPHNGHELNCALVAEWAREGSIDIVTFHQKEGARREREAITELVEAALHERVLQHEQIEAQILTAAQRDAATTRQAVVLARALSCATASYVEVLAILKSRYKENTDARTSE